MRKPGLALVVLLLVLLTGVVLRPRGAQSQPGPSTIAHAAGQSRAALPAVFSPDATPLPPTPLPVPTATGTPLATPTPTATTEPLPGNALVNGSFEDGWTDLPPAPGFLINQQPNGWSLAWLAMGDPLWDDASTIVQGIPESLHKLADQLPPDEQPGGSRPLILDGLTTYKMFHFGAPFGSQLMQTVSGLPAGTRWRLVVPVQVHIHGDADPWSAESGAWAITSATQSGGWVPAGDMGDRRWFYHNVEFTVPNDGRVELLIRVKSKWFRAKDFFIDDVRLQPLGTAQLAPYKSRPTAQGDSITWGERPLGQIPARQLVLP